MVMENYGVKKKNPFWGKREGKGEKQETAFLEEAG